MNALQALNCIENGGAVLVSLPGSFLSSTFRMKGNKIESGNYEIGFCEREKSKSEIYAHFADMLNQGGEIVAI